MAPLTNAERQARWREKRNELAKKAENFVKEAETLGPASERVAMFLANLAVLMQRLEKEGRKDLATFSPNTVRRYVKLVQDQVAAMSSGSDIPELPGADRKKAREIAAELRGET